MDERKPNPPAAPAGSAKEVLDAAQALAALVLPGEVVTKVVIKTQNGRKTTFKLPPPPELPAND